MDLETLEDSKLINYTNNIVQAIEKTSNVDRFHGHCVLKEQTVADHSARVAMISFQLALEYYNDFEKASIVSTYALHHDIAEGLIGSDVSGWVKSQKGIRNLIHELELEVIEAIIPEQKPVIRKVFKTDVDQETHFLIKISDTLDMGLYLKREYQLGNRCVDNIIRSFFKEYEIYPQKFKALPLAYQIYCDIKNVCKDALVVE